jgi:hypothetical protein
MIYIFLLMKNRFRKNDWIFTLFHFTLLFITTNHFEAIWLFVMPQTLPAIMDTMSGIQYFPLIESTY